MLKICFATSNQGKIEEIKKEIEGKLEISGLKELGCLEDIPETQDTIEGNAIQKANYVWENYNTSCFAEDTGLIVPSINNEPGVYSARYAKKNNFTGSNTELLLSRLGDDKDCSAYFKTCIALNIEGKITLFTGEVHGTIIKKPKGDGGFGYDPVFLPNGKEKTFAEMTTSEKNEISHRGIASRKLISYLKDQ